MKFTEDTLNATILVLPYFDLAKIDGVEETTDAWRLGEIGLSKNKPMVRAYLRGFSAVLADTAQFRIMPFNVPDLQRAGWAAIFSRFMNDDLTEEYLAGWVPENQLPALKEWVEFMNQHIKRLLALKASA